MRRRYVQVSTMTLAMLAAACSSSTNEDSAPSDGGAEDASVAQDGALTTSDGPEASASPDAEVPDASVRLDASLDSGGDATTESGVDSGSDAAGDAGSDAGSHAPAGARSGVENSQTTGTAVDAMTSDWYKVTGNAGDRLLIGAYADQLQPNGGYDPTVISTTIVLLGSDANPQSPLTYQNGQWPALGQDSVLYVELPTTGTYYVGVQDCNALLSSGCANPPSGISSFDYTLAITPMQDLTPPETYASTTNNGTVAHADAVTYHAGGSVTIPAPAAIGGDFSSGAATQTFQFTPPSTAVAPTGARARAEFYLQSVGHGVGGDLSSAPVRIWATDATGTTISSLADQANYAIDAGSLNTPLDLSLPYVPGQTYYLFVQNEDTSGTAAKDFYFVQHRLNSLLDVAEKEVFGQHTNDTSNSPQTLSAQGPSHTFFAIDGNISAPATAGTPDIDYYSLVVPSAVTTYRYQCDAARTGSGLGGFHFALLKNDAATVIAAQTESATSDLQAASTILPTGVTPGSSIFVKLSAGTQSTTTTGTQYRCYVSFE